MNSSYYKHCIVPQCKSTTIKTPNKLFIYVPNNKKIREKWLRLARRDDAHSLSTDSRMYFCEDHFDLPNDMLNYTQYHIMGTVSQVRMKPGCTPKKFECQEDCRKRTSDSPEEPCVLKKQRILTTTESPKDPEESHLPSLNDTADTSSDFQTIQENAPEILHHNTADKSVQASVMHKFRSKAVQTEVKSTAQPFSPSKPSLVSRSTSPITRPISPYNTEYIIKSNLSPSGLSKSTRHIHVLIEEEHINSDVYLHIKPTAATSRRSLSVHSSTTD